MQIDATTVICAILGSTVFTTAFTKLLDLIIEKCRKDSPQKRASRLTLLYVIKEGGKAYVAEGSICETDYRAFEETYKTYKDLGGDGYADKIHEEVNKLPMKGI